MIWLTWRQQRTETLIAILVLALVTAVLVPTGLHIASVYDHDGIGGCLAHPTGTCTERLDAFAGRWDSLSSLTGWFNLLPGLIGALLAAPLVLELERGTFRLAWTQSITRRRWLTTRLALLVGAAVAFALQLTLLMSWWRHPLDAVDGRFQNGFDFEGLVPTAYMLFAAAVVLAFGVVLRRTAAAIGLGFAAFFALRIGIEGWVRQHYVAPVHKTWTGGELPGRILISPADALLRTAWVLNRGSGFSATRGHRPDPSIVESCIKNASTRGFERTCLAQHHITEYEYAVYQPASRFWLFQAIEAGIFVALSLALLGFAIYWIRRRVS